MKFKSLTKLAMSGVALAAAATTLGASTYAWYVVNPTANVTNINAATANAGDTSILVSKNGETFAGKVAFGAADYNGTGDGSHYADNNVNNPFVPVRPKGATDLTAFYDAGVEDVSASTATASTAYLKFSVWVKAAKPQTVAVKLSALNNTGVTSTQATAVLPTQYAYQDVTTSITATDSFTVDAVHALRTAVIVNDNTTSGQTVYETDKIAYTQTYQASAKYSTLSLGDVNDTNKLTNATAVIVDENGEEATITGLSGAHLYYTQVMSETPVTMEDTATVTDATNISNITLSAANTAVKLTFIIWLEGGDDLCFDACGGQNFQFGLQFDAVS